MTYHHGNLREALVTAGEALLTSGGPEAVTLRAVARDAGVSHSAPLRHFPDRHALLVEIALRGFLAWGEAVTAAADQAGAVPVDRLRAALLAYVAFSRQHPQRIDLMFAVASSPKPPQLEQAMQGAFENLARLVAAASPKEADARRIAVALWSQVHGLAVLARSVDLDKLSPPGLGQSASSATIALAVDALLGDATL